MIRALLLAASAIGGAVALGRKYVDKSIDKKLDGEIETAKALAIEQLDREIHDVVGHRVGAIAFSLLVKAGLVATVFIVYSGGYISETIFRGGVLALITAYIGYDFFRHWPHVPTAIKLFRNYRFDAKRALKEYVVTVAFDRAYEETMKRLSTGIIPQMTCPNRLPLLFPRSQEKSVLTASRPGSLWAPLAQG